jgi:hypothetical protein
MHRRWFPLLGGLCLALAACAGPVGTTRVDSRTVLRHLGRSAVSTGEPSLSTRNVLFERGLFEAFDKDPEAAMAELHRAMLASQGDEDLLFALAELSLLHGQATTKPDYYLAAAVYAYAFLFPDNAGGAAPGRFDPRVRSAADLYNWTLTAAFKSPDTSEVVPRGGSFTLPFGRIDVAFDPAELRAGDRELYRLIPVAELDVYGLQMRYRWPGLGAPLAASTRPIDAARPGRDMVAPRLQVPVTALLRIPDARSALVEGRPLTGTLELHLAWDAESVSIAGEQVPLENEPSAALALTFTGVPIVELETLGLLGRLTGLMRERPPLVSATPYRPGLIPVVFVHGTASSIVRLTGVAAEINRNPGAAKVGFVPTAVDNMSPGHPFILGLQAIPVVPSVTVNSIIAVEGDGPVEQGDDGVVKYSAAHIEPVESELVVKSSHSTQGNPHTIEEVRRILLLHAGVKTGARGPAAAPMTAEDRGRERSRVTPADQPKVMRARR